LMQTFIGNMPDLTGMDCKTLLMLWLWRPEIFSEVDKEKKKRTLKWRGVTLRRASFILEDFPRWWDLVEVGNRMIISSREWKMSPLDTSYDGCYLQIRNPKFMKSKRKRKRSPSDLSSSSDEVENSKGKKAKRAKTNRINVEFPEERMDVESRAIVDNSADNQNPDGDPIDTPSHLSNITHPGAPTGASPASNAGPAANPASKPAEGKAANFVLAGNPSKPDNYANKTGHSGVNPVPNTVVNPVPNAVVNSVPNAAVNPGKTVVTTDPPRIPRKLISGGVSNASDPTNLLTSAPMKQMVMI